MHIITTFGVEPKKRPRRQRSPSGPRKKRLLQLGEFKSLALLESFNITKLVNSSFKGLKTLETFSIGSLSPQHNLDCAYSTEIPAPPPLTYI